MVITVDDFGYNQQANQLIFKAIDQGVIDQVSTMVNMAGSKEALEYIKMSLRGAQRRSNLLVKLQKSKSKFQINSKNQNPNYHSVKFGLHLNLTEGKPLNDPIDVPSLIDKNGQFIDWPGLIKRSIFGQLRSQDIELETRAQIEKLQTVVKPIPFLNSHHHLHLWPLVAKIVLPLCKEYNIDHIRWPHKIWWRSLLTRHGLKALTVQLLPKLSSIDHGLLSNDYFFDLDWRWRDSDPAKKITDSFPRNIELACHPLPTPASIINRLIKKAS